jgi:hypothetical protein
MQSRIAYRVDFFITRSPFPFCGELPTASATTVASLVVLVIVSIIILMPIVH